MAFLRKVALAVLIITFFTFVALFGRLPALRSTPIGFLHRLIWNHLPRAIENVDQRLTGGRLTTSLARLLHYLGYEKHPLVLILFLSLLTTSAFLFLRPAWHLLSTPHHLTIILLLPPPYLFTYLCATSTASQIHPSPNHNQPTYPYDYTLYNPTSPCRTCTTPKYPRSKHCPICRACIARHDHHCVWVNNCLGSDNYRWFLALLFSLGVLLVYGAALSYTLLRHYAVGQGTGIRGFFERAGEALASDARIGGVGLLAGLTAPLAWGLLAFHVYLIWAGTTTNETQKWEDLKVDMADGLVWVGKRSVVFPGREECGSGKEKGMGSEWPATSNQIVRRTDDGQMPRVGAADRIRDMAWEQCWHLSELVNVYDIGFMDNFRDAVGLL